MVSHSKESLEDHCAEISRSSELVRAQREVIECEEIVIEQVINENVKFGED
jgi:hypothetical protein